MKRVRNPNLIGSVMLLLLVPLFAFSDTPTALNSETLAHNALEIEQKYGLNVTRSHRATLDKIVNGASARVQSHFPKIFTRHGQDISTKRQINRTEAIEIFTLVDGFLTEANVVHGQTHFLSESFAGRYLDAGVVDVISKGQPLDANAKMINNGQSSFIKENAEKMHHISKHLHEKFYFANCEIMSVLYKSIFQNLGVDIHIVKAPKHSFVRWQSENEYLNVEVTNFNFYTDTDYIEHFQITKDLIDKGIFLRSIEPDEEIAYLYVHLGNYYMDLAHKASSNKDHSGMLHGYNKAIELYTVALNKSSRLPTANNNRGVAYLEVAYLISGGNRPKALELTQRAQDEIGLAIKQYSNEEFLANQDRISLYIEQLM